MKKFDLNIEKILENWDVKHAVREIIANAIDEQKLTKTKQIEIFKSAQNCWHIRDYGRGLKYDHFTQKENDEKLNHQGIIGKFGIGLKDALATFERKGIEVKMLSKHGSITLGKSQKSGFDDLTTLHAYISEPSNLAIVGTEFILKNIFDSDVHQAKNLFLKFTNERVIEKTKNGEVLQKTGSQGNIYINGVLVAVEENFLFSYNITNLNTAIKKAINRERTNVGRAAYANSVKTILLECASEEIGNCLSADLAKYSYGNSHDELKWIDVQQHAAKILNNFRKVVFVTSDEIERGTDLVNEARQGGSQIVVIPTNLRDKIAEQNINENDDNKVRIFSEFVTARNENFEFKFISGADLSLSEKAVFDCKEQILSFIGGKPSNVKEILISETMQKDEYTFLLADAVWSHVNGTGKIIIKRSVLKDRERFIAVLLHELAHAISGATDATRRFESELTRLLGVFGKEALKSFGESEDLKIPTPDTINEDNFETDRIEVGSSTPHSVSICIDPKIEKLKLEAKLMEAEVNALSIEKTDLEKLIHDFEVRHNQELGELIIKILKFRKEKAKATKQEEETEQDYNNYQKQYDTIKEEKLETLTEEEQKELKDKYRKASKLSHPDVVSDEQKEVANKLFTELNEAYERNELQQIKDILENLEKENLFINKSDATNKEKLLIIEIEKLRSLIKDLKDQVQGIKESEAYKTVISIDNWDDYFTKTKQNLLQQLKEIEHAGI